jgi:hypothetical protein
MEIGARLRKRWYLVILAAIIAVLVGATAVVKFGHSGLKVKRSVYRVGIGQLLVDTNPSTLTNITSGAGSLGGRAALIAQFSTGPQVANEVAKLAGVSTSSLTLQAQTTSATKTGGSASKSLAKVGKGTESVLLRTAGQSQTITITSQAHTDALAKSLVSATMRAMIQSLRRLQNSQPFNHQTAVTTSTSTTSTSTTTTPPASGATGKTGAKTGKGSAATNTSNQAAARAAQRQKALASQKARQIQQSKLVLRRLGSVRVTKVVIGASKSKAIGYAVGAFIVLLLLILGLDGLLRGSGGARKPSVPPEPLVSERVAPVPISPDHASPELASPEHVAPGGISPNGEDTRPFRTVADEPPQTPAAETPAPEPSARD